MPAPVRAQAQTSIAAPVVVVAEAQTSIAAAAAVVGAEAVPSGLALLAAVAEA